MESESADNARHRGEARTRRPHPGAGVSTQDADISSRGPVFRTRRDPTRHSTRWHPRWTSGLQPLPSPSTRSPHARSAASRHAGSRAPALVTPSVRTPAIRSADLATSERLISPSPRSSRLHSTRSPSGCVQPCRLSHSRPVHSRRTL